MSIVVSLGESTPYPVITLAIVYISQDICSDVGLLCSLVAWHEVATCLREVDRLPLTLISVRLH